MKKILLFARDPGGANTIIPLVEPLRAKGYQLLIFGKDIALSKFQKNGIKANDISLAIDDISQEKILHFVKEEKPDFIITGTSANDMTEKYIWKASETLEIPSFAILDQWINYAIRFSVFDVSEIEMFEKNRNLKYLPSKILVMDELAKEEAIKEGIPEDKILISGQPYFQQLLEKKIDKETALKIKKKLGIKNDDFVVTFASEPVQKSYKNNYWGYNETTIFSSLVKELEKYSKEIRKRIVVIIKLHPKEDRKYYNLLIKELPNNTKIKIFLDQTSNSSDIIAISDLICGMSSMFLLESLIMNRPTLSVQIGLKRDNPFVLDRIGVLKSILEQDKLIEEIKKATTEDRGSFSIISNPVERTIKFMEQVICQS